MSCRAIVISLSFLVLIVGCSFSKETVLSPRSQSPQLSKAPLGTLQSSYEKHISTVPNNSLSPPEGVFKRKSPNNYEPDSLTIIHSPPTNNQARYSCVIFSAGKANTLIDSIKPKTATRGSYRLKHTGAATEGTLKIKQTDKNTLLLVRPNTPPLSFQLIGDHALTLVNKEMQMDRERIKHCLKGNYFISRTCENNDPRSCLPRGEMMEFYTPFSCERPPTEMDIRFLDCQKRK